MPSMWVSTYSLARRLQVDLPPGRVAHPRFVMQQQCDEPVHLDVGTHQFSTGTGLLVAPCDPW